MQDETYKIIKSWAGVSTWYTSHPLDQRRFYKAMNRLVSELGNNIDIGEFEIALRRYAEEGSDTLGRPEFWDETINSFVLKAETIFGYEQEK